MSSSVSSYKPIVLLRHTIILTPGILYVENHAPLRSLSPWSSLPKEAAGERGDEGHFDEQSNKGFDGGQDSERVV